jgi:ketosteroid isomerase-like protein
MSSGLFHTDWYTDPPWDNVSLSWLINYVKNIRSNPELSKALAAEKDQFEMVPMPKEVIQHLAQSRLVSTSVGFTSAQHLDVVGDVVRKFVRALETEKPDDAAALLSPTYKDAEGRDANGIKTLLRKMAAASSGLRIVPFSTQSLLQVGDHLVATLQVAWEVNLKEGAASVRKSANSQLEVVLEKDPHGGWKISGIRTL